MTEIDRRKCPPSDGAPLASVLHERIRYLRHRLRDENDPNSRLRLWALVREMEVAQSLLEALEGRGHDGICRN